MYVEIGVKDFVTFGMRGKSEFGIQNYHLPKSTALDLPQVARIHKGKRPTYIDDAIKLKKYVPEPNKYETATDLSNNKRSFLCKGARKLMTDDIANF